MNESKWHFSRISLLIFALVLLGSCFQKDEAAVMEEKINELVGQMTLEEKAMLVVGTGYRMPQGWGDMEDPFASDADRQKAAQVHCLVVLDKGQDVVAMI